LLVRHGETHWNREQRIQGQRNSELSPAGIQQANAAAARLACEGADGLVASDLGRTLQTAAPIAAATGLAIETRVGLRERAFGVFEGRTLEEIALEFPSEYARWRARDPDYAMPGGESLEQLRERVKGTLEAIAARGHRKVLVVTHGGVLDAAYRVAAGVADAARRTWPLVNASVNSIDVDASGWRLHEWGNVAHLGKAGDEPG
jgi:probable phosphoglycerate mutase